MSRVFATPYHRMQQLSSKRIFAALRLPGLPEGFQIESTPRKSSLGDAFDQLDKK